MGFVPINLAVSEEELIKVLALPPSKAVPLAAAASHLLSFVLLCRCRLCKVHVRLPGLNLPPSPSDSPPPPARYIA